MTKPDTPVEEELTEELALVRHERKRLTELLREQRERVLNKYPLIFALLGSFGLVTTYYGFENIIDRVAILKANPGYMLAIGVVVLLLTGSLYRRLG